MKPGLEAGKKLRNLDFKLGRSYETTLILYKARRGPYKKLAEKRNNHKRVMKQSIMKQNL
jgi:hypothetical protein